MAKPLFKLCRRGLHEQNYDNTFVDHRGYTGCRACRILARRRYYKKKREQLGKSVGAPPDKVNHYKVCRLAGLSLYTAIYLVGISEHHGRKIDRTMVVRPV